MPLEQSPLDPTTVPDGARKVLTGPAPVKLMAARGLAPLKPTELAIVLYQLATVPGEDADESIKQAALKSTAELPEKILAAALADPGLDPRVLDFFAPKLVGRPALVEVVLLNRATADSTVADLVPKLDEKLLELVATNEQRLLRHPAVIGALYLNPRARMSTVDRCIELAVRNKITVPGIARWDDLVQAVLGQQSQPKPSAAEIDATFGAVARVAVGDAPTDDLEEIKPDDDLEVVNEKEEQKVEEVKKDIPIDKLTMAQKIRLATLGNAYARAILIRDPVRVVAIAAIESPGMTDNEVIKYSANRTLADDVIRIIANTREWLKIYQIKKNLVNNAKCPLPVSMRLLPFLHERDLRDVGRSRAIPSALTAQAKKLLQQKGKG